MTDSPDKRGVKLSVWVHKAGRDAIADLATKEQRSISDMSRVLLGEAVKARTGR